MYSLEKFQQVKRALGRWFAVCLNTKRCFKHNQPRCVPFSTLDLGNIVASVCPILPFLCVGFNGPLLVYILMIKMLIFAKKSQHGDRKEKLVLLVNYNCFYRNLQQYCHIIESFSIILQHCLTFYLEIVELSTTSSLSILSEVKWEQRAKAGWSTREERIDVLSQHLLKKTFRVNGLYFYCNLSSSEDHNALPWARLTEVRLPYNPWHWAP